MDISPEKVYNILIADDHQMFIDGVKLSLRKEASFKVIAQALTGIEAYEIIQSTPVDIIITDISMPEMSGVELSYAIKQHYSHIKVLVITSYSDIEIINEIVSSGAEGYLLKNAGKHELIKALKKISEGGLYYAEEVSAILFKQIQQSNPRNDIVKKLTPREIQIIELIAKEYSSVQIAAELKISPFTVETHRKNIYEKTNSKTVVGLIKFALESNLLSH
jgi:DNA-binding NarL/FixJ family response regulator